MGPAASFRDPAGLCFVEEERVFRVVFPAGMSELDAFLASASAQRFVADRRLIPTRRLQPEEVAHLEKHVIADEFSTPEGRACILEHERVPFVSYPYEWAPEMLFAAAKLTLDLAQECLREGFGLKDATPYNVLFRGCEPVFVDIASFERRAPGDGVWKPYAQFVRSFVLPLLVNRQWGNRLGEIFLTRRDGYEPEDVYAMCGPIQKILPPFLALATVPTWLSRKKQMKAPSFYEQRLDSDSERAQYILQSLFKRLRRRLAALKPRQRNDSVWSAYTEHHNYSAAALAAKRDFVRNALRDHRPRRVLDLGANTGHFSMMAAEEGAEVVAIDLDPLCIGALWEQAQREGRNVLPLVVNIARPTPAVGWHNRECPGFLERASGKFDGVLMLAVLHHLLVSERIPLDEVLELAAELTTDLLIIEFVTTEDDMFRLLARGRDHLFRELNQLFFEQSCRRRFEIVRQSRLADAHRWIYLLRKRKVASA